MKENIKILLIKNKLKQEDLAKVLGVNLSTLNMKINQRREFTRSEINKILKFFNVQYEEIFFE